MRRNVSRVSRDDRVIDTRFSRADGGGDAVVAMTDRLLHIAEVVSTKGDSQRLKDRDFGKVPTDDAHCVGPGREGSILNWWQAIERLSAGSTVLAGAQIGVNRSNGLPDSDFNVQPFVRSVACVEVFQRTCPRAYIAADAESRHRLRNDGAARPAPDGESRGNGGGGESKRPCKREGRYSSRCKEPGATTGQRSKHDVCRHNCA